MLPKFAFVDLVWIWTLAACQLSAVRGTERLMSETEQQMWERCGPEAEQHIANCLEVGTRGRNSGKGSKRSRGMGETLSSDDPPKNRKPEKIKRREKWDRNKGKESESNRRVTRKSRGNQKIETLVSWRNLGSRKPKKTNRFEKMELNSKILILLKNGGKVDRIDDGRIRKRMPY